MISSNKANIISDPKTGQFFYMFPRTTQHIKVNNLIVNDHKSQKSNLSP